MSDLTCPYCEYRNDVPDECHETSYIHETECDECNKIFGFEVEYYPTYSERELNCKNGEPHKYNMVNYHSYGFSKGYCEYCDEGKQIEIEKKDLPNDRYILEAQG